LVLLLHDRALPPDHGEPITLTLALSDFDDDFTKIVVDKQGKHRF